MQLKSGMRACSALAIVLCCTVSNGAHAASETADNETGLAPAAVGDIWIGAGTQSIMVTGSRIPRGSLTHLSPIETITREDMQFDGRASIADVLQDPQLTSGSAQVNGTFLGFSNAEGGAAANTLGLRGLGPGRTLVLLNGRRLAPAGSGPRLVAPDLNVLPTALVQRVEILREGASSIYGSDAVAGVVNVITGAPRDGFTLDFATTQPVQYSGQGGRSYRGSLIWGKELAAGHLTAALEVRQTAGLRANARDEFTCPRDLFTDPATGAEVGQLDPSTGDVRCHPFQYAALGTAQDYLLGLKYPTTKLDRFAYVGGDISAIRLVNDHDQRPLANAVEDDRHILTPLRTITAFVDGAYEIAPSAEIYGEALYSNRRSHQDAVSQISIDPIQLGSELWGGALFGLPVGNFVPAETVSPFFPDAVAALGYNALRAFIVPPLLERRQDVEFYRVNGGLRGALGVGDLHYDANLQYARSHAAYSFQGLDTRNLKASLRTVLAPDGMPADLVTAALPGQKGAGKAYTCASNLDAGGALIAGSSCVPINIFAPSVLAGDIPGNVFDYLYPQHSGASDFEQWTGQLVVDGTLFDLPGGRAGFALGYEHRSDYLNDVPSEAAQSGNLYFASSAQITSGRDRVDEVFGELALPLLADRPFFHELSLAASLRYTNYQSYGSDWTYHIGGQWAPMPQLRIRGSYGTSFRAPNLYEQFVADQSGFMPAAIDPCNDFARGHAPGDPIYDNCLADLAGHLNSDVNGDLVKDNFIATRGPEVVTKGGAGLLAAEQATTWGFGAVLTLGSGLGSGPDGGTGDMGFTLSADYFDIDLRNEVSLLGAAILNLCYESEAFRAGDDYCDLVAARDPAQGNLTRFDNPYLNAALRTVKGIDATADFHTGLAGGRFAARLHATRMLEQSFAQFEGDTSTDLNGQLGFHGSTGGPKWTGQLDLTFTAADDHWQFHYGLDYVGVMDTQSTIANPHPLVRGIAVDIDLVAEEYWKHGLSVQYRCDCGTRVTLGVSNLFDTKPSVIGTYTSTGVTFPKIGNYFNYSGYDFIGRSVFVNVSKPF